MRSAANIDTEIEPAASAAEPDAPVTANGEGGPAAVLDAGDLFAPRAIVECVSMWMIGPTMSGLIASVFTALVSATCTS
jgi:PiT family inorganic phosphate transporter